MTRPLSRRSLLASLPLLAGAAAAPVRREVFLASPGKGIAVTVNAYYTKPSGGAMMSIEQRWTRSDTVDAAFYRYSNDFGRTWSKPERRETGEKTAAGMLRRHLRGGFVDPVHGWFVATWNEGVLPSDDPLEGMRQWNIYYTISKDGGRTRSAVHQMIHKGAEFGPRHPLPGVYTGKNATMTGDYTGQPCFSRDGTILLPIQISPLGPDGKLYNPSAGYTYTDAAVAHGRWKGNALEWELSSVVKGDPTRSTRGMVEPTVEFLARGRALMVMRGSNDRKPELPSYRWVSFSDDGGWKWSEPRPWTFHDGTPFFSPSSCSQLVRHSGGKLYWLGNITPENPGGNRPRYPFCIGEVDQESGLLIRDRVRIVDDKRPEDDPILTLSNFFAREDRKTHEIALHMTRMFAFQAGWEGDAMLYRIPV